MKTRTHGSRQGCSMHWLHGPLPDACLDGEGGVQMKLTEAPSHQNSRKYPGVMEMCALPFSLILACLDRV